MLIRYLPPWCRDTSTRPNRGSLPIFANTWDLIRYVWFGAATDSPLFVGAFVTFSIISSG
jgi:hypothetical protein